MNKKHIQDLLDKYFEGETSLEEEQELKRFFQKTEILPEEWKAYKHLFAYFVTEGTITLPVKDGIQKKKNTFWVIATGFSLAASVLILLTLFIPTTNTKLEHFATVSPHLDSFYTGKVQAKSLAMTNTIRSTPEKESKLKHSFSRKIISDDTSTILAGATDGKNQKTSIGVTIDEALTPLEKMNAINNALDKLKYFDLMDKYLPGHDLSSLMRTDK
ncbi:MAG: hypothetical protein Q8908_10745 [Bacteroidota bacterium]|nr:hypothetical protein [Bacteroidota bacterium]